MGVQLSPFAPTQTARYGPAWAELEWNLFQFLKAEPLRVSVRSGPCTEVRTPLSPRVRDGSLESRPRRCK